MRPAPRKRLIALLVPAFVAHLLCVCAPPASAGVTTQMRAGQSPSSAHACCRPGTPAAPKVPTRRAATCRYCSAPELSPPDASRLAAPAPGPLSALPALPSVSTIALAQSAAVPAFGRSSDPPGRLALRCVLQL